MVSDLAPFWLGAMIAILYRDELFALGHLVGDGIGRLICSLVFGEE